MGIQYPGASLGANTFTGAQAAPTLALGGATIGANALAVTGTTNISGLTKIGTSAGSNQLEVGKNQNATTEISVRNTDTTNTTSRAFVRAYSGAVTGMMGAITGTAAYVGSDTNHPFNLTINGSPAATLSTDGAFTIGVNPKSLTGATALWAGVTNLSSLALGGATIGGNALAVTGAVDFSSTASFGSTISAYGNYSTGATRVIGWGNSSIGTIDSAFSRISAGIIGVGTGAAGSVAGGMQMATLKATLQTNANATTGLVAGVLAATTNASIVITDGSGQVYRIPCII